MIIRTINASDFDFIIELTAAENVRYTKKDLSRIIDYEPEGCFIALDGERRLGVVTTIVFGRVGWIGNVFVAKSSRRLGAGSKLVREALQYVRRKGVEYAKLYCFPHRIAFYRRLGFVAELNVQIVGGVGRALSFSRVEELPEDSFDELVALDGRMFGADRSRMLRRLHQEFREYCFGAYADDELVGYVMACGSGSDYELGPWVCEPHYQDVFAEELLRAEMNRLDGKSFELSSPMHNPSVEIILEKYDFKQEGVAVRMGHGRAHIEKAEGILGIAGLDRG